jgi:hypothetical protein
MTIGFDRPRHANRQLMPLPPPRSGGRTKAGPRAAVRASLWQMGALVAPDRIQGPDA